MVVPNLLEPYDFSFLKIRIEGKIVFEVIKKIEASLKEKAAQSSMFSRGKKTKAVREEVFPSQK